MQELLEKIKTILSVTEGWCSFEKASEFVKYILDNKLNLLVEIGVFGGSSLIPQALALKELGRGKIYGIDPWTNEDALEEVIDNENKVWWEKLDIQRIYEHCVGNLEKYEISTYCQLIRDKAENVVDMFENESIDLLHIDGNHSEALSYKDATLYLPKVKTNGFIFFDDIWWTEGGNQVTTRKAINYLLEKCEQITVVNNDCMILKKIKS